MKRHGKRSENRTLNSHLRTGMKDGRRIEKKRRFTFETCRHVHDKLLASGCDS